MRNASGVSPAPVAFQLAAANENLHLWHFSACGIYKLGGGKGEVPGAGLGVVPGAAGVAPGGGVAVGPGVAPGVRAGVGVGEGPVSSKFAGWLPAWQKGTV